AAADHFLRPGDPRGAGIGQTSGAAVAFGARRDRPDTQPRGDDHLRLRHRQLFAQFGQMAAGQMAGLVRQYADDLVRSVRLHQGAIVYEDAVAVGDEGVKHGFVDDGALDVLLLETRYPQDRSRVLAKQLLAL